MVEKGEYFRAFHQDDSRSQLYHSNSSSSRSRKRKTHTIFIFSKNKLLFTYKNITWYSLLIFYTRPTKKCYHLVGHLYLASCALSSSGETSLFPMYTISFWYMHTDFVSPPSWKGRKAKRNVKTAYLLG